MSPLKQRENSGMVDEIKMFKILKHEKNKFGLKNKNHPKLSVSRAKIDSKSLITMLTNILNNTSI